MPLGKYSKQKVRKVAAEAGLKVAEKPESQEICFIPDNNYGNFLKSHVPDIAKPGPILDSKGKVLGEHQGIAFYTIGQRKGLGIAHSRPLYVTDIDRERNTVIVGEDGEALRKEFVVDEVSFISGCVPKEPLAADVKIRYKFEPARATVTPLDGSTARVVFEQPQRAITPGQAAVFYDGDEVIGGGTIKTVVNSKD